MTHYRQGLMAAAATFAMALSACGGGSGGGTGFSSVSAPPPPPPPGPPPPPPPPPPPNYAIVFPGITATTDFAVLGAEAAVIPSSISALATSGFSVRYDAAAGAYIFDLPSQLPTPFETDYQDDNFWYAWIDGSSWAGTNLRVLKPTNPSFPLSYTSYAAYYDYDYDDYAPVGFAAFGIPTPAAGVPTTGSADYTAIVVGETLDRGLPVGGTASLMFNFGTGTLSGTFSPSTYANAGYVSLGTYNFVNTVFGVGSTTFSGQLQHSGAPTLGAFNGMFTGPAAQELMSRWTAPYLNPDSNQWSEMFGIWVGKKP